MSLGLCSGCISSGSGWRALALNPLQKSRSAVSSPQSDHSAGRSKIAALSKPVEPNRQEIQQVTDQQESVDDSGGGSNADVTPAPDNMPMHPELQTANGLSLAELEVIATQYNPTLSQAQAAISAEQGVFHQDGLYPNPQFGYLNGSASKPGVKQSNGGFFSQEIVTNHKIQYAQAASAVEIKRYQWDYEAQRQRILNDLKIRYYEVLGAQEALAVSERLVKIAERGLAMAEKRMEGIHGTKTDLLQARVQLETVNQMRDEAMHRYEGAWDRLATMTGTSWLKPVHLTEDLAQNIPQLDLASSIQNLENSPQLRSIECDLGHAWATYQVAKAQAIPNATVQVVGEYDQAFQASIVTTLVAMPVPLINRNQGNIEKASADVVAAQAELSRVKLLQRESLSDTFQAYKDNLKKVQRLQNVILKSAEENLKLTEEVFESGEVGFDRVMAAQQSYFQSQLDYVQALTEVHKAVAAIEGYQLTGGLNPAAIGGAIQNQPGGGTTRQRALLGELQDKSSKQLLPAAQISQ